MGQEMLQHRGGMYTEATESSGEKSGDFCSRLLHNATSGVQVWVHGHDKVLLGTRKEVLALEEVLGGKLLLKRTEQPCLVSPRAMTKQRGF